MDSPDSSPLSQPVEQAQFKKIKLSESANSNANQCRSMMERAYKRARNLNDERAFKFDEMQKKKSKKIGRTSITNKKRFEMAEAQDYLLDVPMATGQRDGVPYGNGTSGHVLVPEFVKKFKSEDKLINQLQSQLAAAFIQRYDSIKFTIQKSLDDEVDVIQDPYLTYPSRQSCKAPQEIALETYAKTCISTIEHVFSKNNFMQEHLQIQEKAKLFEKMISKLTQERSTVLSPKSMNSSALMFQSMGKSQATVKTTLDYSSADSTDEILISFLDKKNISASGPKKTSVDQGYLENLEQLKLNTKSKKEQIHSLKSKLEAAEALIEEQKTLINKTRNDYLKDIAALRESLHLCGSTHSKEQINKYKGSLKVHFFDDMEGVPTELIETLNLKLNISRREAETEIGQKQCEINDLQQTIAKYKSLAPETFRLLDLSLKQIFDSLRIIEPKAYPIWAALTAAYPVGHFTSVIKEALLGDGMMDQDTYDQLIQMVEKSIKDQLEKCETTLEEARKKISWTETLRGNERRMLLKERDDHEKELTLARNDALEQAQEWIQKELQNQAVRYDKEKSVLQKRLEQQQQQIDEYQQVKVKNQMQNAFFMFRISHLHAKTMDRMQNESMAEDQVRRLYTDELKKIVCSSPVEKLQNSLDEAEATITELREEYRNQHQQNYDLRLKVNTLLEERQFLLNRLDTLQVNYDSMTVRLTAELTQKKDLELDHKHNKQRLQATIDLLKRQIEIKENLEDKFGARSRELTDEQRKQLNDQKQKKLKEVLIYFEQDLKARESKLDVELQKQKSSQLTSASRRMETQTAKTQTILKSAMNRDIEMKVIHEKPFREQSDLVPKADFECQTDVTGNQFNHLVKGCFLYGQIADGVLKINRQMPEADYPDNLSEPPYSFLQNLAEREKRYHILLFENQQKVFEEQLADYTKTSEQSTVRTGTNSGGGSIPHGARSGVHKTHESSQRGAPRSQHSDMNLQQFSNTHSQKGNIQIRQGMNDDLAKIPSLMSLSSNQQMLPSALNIDKPRFSNQTIEEHTKNLSEYQVAPSPEMQILFQNIDINQLKSAAEKTSAMSSFQMYIELLDMIKELEPALFRFCVQKLKQDKFEKFELLPPEVIQNKYPAFIPDVFLRLWNTDLEPEEKHRRQKYLDQSKLEWIKRLESRGWYHKNPSTTTGSNQPSPANRVTGPTKDSDVCSPTSREMLKPIGVPSRTNSGEVQFEAIVSTEKIQTTENVASRKIIEIQENETQDLTRVESKHEEEVAEATIVPPQPKHTRKRRPRTGKRTISRGNTKAIYRSAFTGSVPPERSSYMGSIRETIDDKVLKVNTNTIDALEDNRLSKTRVSNLQEKMSSAQWQRHKSHQSSIFSLPTSTYQLRIANKTDMQAQQINNIHKLQYKNQIPSDLGAFGKQKNSQRPFSGKGPTIATELFGESEGRNSKQFKMFSPSTTDGNALTISRYGTNILMDQAQAEAYKQVMGQARKQQRNTSAIINSKNNLIRKRSSGSGGVKSVISGQKRFKIQRPQTSKPRVRQSHRNILTHDYQTDITDIAVPVSARHQQQESAPQTILKEKEELVEGENSDYPFTSNAGVSVLGNTTIHVVKDGKLRSGLNKNIHMTR